MTAAEEFQLAMQTFDAMTREERRAVLRALYGSGPVEARFIAAVLSVVRKVKEPACG